MRTLGTTVVSIAELLGPPIRTVALAIYFAASLRDTSPNGNVGTDTLGSLGETVFPKRKQCLFIFIFN